MDGLSEMEGLDQDLLVFVRKQLGHAEDERRRESVREESRTVVVSGATESRRSGLTPAGITATSVNPNSASSSALNWEIATVSALRPRRRRSSVTPPLETRGERRVGVDEVRRWCDVVVDENQSFGAPQQRPGHLGIAVTRVVDHYVARSSSWKLAEMRDSRSIAGSMNRAKISLRSDRS